MGEVESLEASDSYWQMNTGEGAYRAKAVIVASGSEPKDLCMPGENRLRGKGVSKTLALESLTEEERKTFLGITQ